ncbi:GNAT family N-acetyltransferase [Nisaea sp.]|uniref:GNAT family N-acetyltransferase n=1 Tax=Nisaea sp. TaxID=2024842 RepID=UPI003299BF02
MQNKRGISQAFSTRPPAQPLQLRAATVFDVIELSEVLIASITQLCKADHGDDPASLQRWTANKAPSDIRRWIAAGQIPHLAELRGRIAGLGLATSAGEVSLLYVAPWAKSCGMGAALLRHLEAELAGQGHIEAHLTATQSGIDFYLSQGWSPCGEANTCHGLPGQPMRKLLQSDP